MKAVEYDSSKKISLFKVVTSLYFDKDLVFLLVKRDLVSRYRRSVLGIAWSLVTPMAMAGVLYFVLSTVFKARLPGGSGYAAFLMSGLILSNLLNQGANSVGFSYSANAGVITKIRTHVLMFPIVSILSSFVNFLLGIIPLILFLILENKTLKFSLIAIPIIGVCTSILILGIGLHVASLAARYQDIHGIMSVFYNILGYATPIIYPLSITKGLVREILSLNPFTNYVELIRACAIDSTYMPSYGLIAYTLILTLIVFTTGVSRLRKNYPSIIEAL